MYYFKIKILNDNYFVTYNDLGITFVGSPNKDVLEINKWFKNVVYKENKRLEHIVKNQIENYLLKKSKTINIEYHLIATNFQMKVYEEISKIKYGEYKTYLEVAVNLGDKNKVRAVANAIGKNPLLFLIPCHRIIGSDKSLKGFRAGIDLKEKLLKLEGVNLDF